MPYVIIIIHQPKDGSWKPSGTVVETSLNSQELNWTKPFPQINGCILDIKDTEEEAEAKLARYLANPYDF